MKKMIDILFLITFIGLTVCVVLSALDPYGEWLAHKVLLIITLSMLLVIQPLNYKGDVE